MQKQSLEKIKDWYMRVYPNDDLGIEINETATFYDLFETLDRRQNVYGLFQVGDSVIRERLFSRLAVIMETSYEYIYQQWLITK